MSEICTKETKEAILEEASFWFARLDGGMSEADYQEWAEWMLASAEHKLAFEKISAMWGDMAILQEATEKFETIRQQRPSVQQEADTSIDLKAPDNVVPLHTETAKKPPQNTVWPRLSVAAGVLLAISVVTYFSTIYTLNDLSQPFTATRDSGEQYSSGFGKQTEVTLADGSTVRLNTDSNIRVDFSNEERRIELGQGEAFFNVAHDSTRPFIVSIDGHEVQALGTAFSVDRSGASLEVILQEGKVSVASPKPILKALFSGHSNVETILHAGDVIRVNKEQHVVNTLTAEEIENDLSWQDGLLIFEDELLPAALAEISRYVDVDFQLDQDSLQKIRVAGVFGVGDIESVLYSLEINFNIISENQGNTILLSQR